MKSSAELIEESQSPELSDQEREELLHQIRKRRVMMFESIDLNLIRLRMNPKEG